MREDMRNAALRNQSKLELRMGRQTAVALSEDDEREFLRFLRADADIRVIQRAAPTPELIFVPEFPRLGLGQRRFHLWNTAFPWQPELGQWSPDHVQDPNLAGQYYVKNRSGAPLIEYLREPLDNPKPLVHGRIYWNTDFAVYTGPAYDTVLFGRWFDKVVRWIRKSGKRVELAKNWSQYWLPGAWKLRPSA
jgi:hypothetical protein